MEDSTVLVEAGWELCLESSEVFPWLEREGKGVDTFLSMRLTQDSWESLANIGRGDGNGAALRCIREE